jgi:hypothetical protein
MHGLPNIKSSEAFGIHQSESSLCSIKDVTMKLAQKGVRRQFLANTLAIKLKGKYGTITEVYFVAKISNSTGHKPFGCEY